MVFRLLVTTAAALPNEDEHRFVSSAFVFFCDDLYSIYVPLHEHSYASAVQRKPRTMVECR
jgi:hypothetical protein